MNQCTQLRDKTLNSENEIAQCLTEYVEKATALHEESNAKQKLQKMRDIPKTRKGKKDDDISDGKVCEVHKYSCLRVT